MKTLKMENDKIRNHSQLADKHDEDEDDEQ